MDTKLQWLHLNTKLEPEPFLHFLFKLSFIVLIQNKGRQPKAIQPLFKYLSPLNYIFPFNRRTSAHKPAPRREEANDCPTLGLPFDNTDTAPCKHQHQRISETDGTIAIDEPYTSACFPRDWFWIS